MLQAYHSALELLKDRFANAFTQKLCKLPKIQNDDYVGLRKFFDNLSQVNTAKDSNRSLSVGRRTSKLCAFFIKFRNFATRVGRSRLLELELSVVHILIFRSSANSFIINPKF